MLARVLRMRPQIKATEDGIDFKSFFFLFHKYTILLFCLLCLGMVFQNLVHRFSSLVDIVIGFGERILFQAHRKIGRAPIVELVELA